MLESSAAVARRIGEGHPLLLAGDEQVLRDLPRGNWIAGTTSYFMTGDGCLCSRDRVFVTPLPAHPARIATYPAAVLPSLLDDAPDSGLTLLILPAGSDVLTAYARDAATYRGIFLKPVAGWVAGTRQPRAVNGATGEWCDNAAVALHLTLPPGKLVEISVLNPFTPGSGPAIRFPASGFEAAACEIDGQTLSFAAYLNRIHADTRLPLTADYNGSILNVSIETVDHDHDRVRFFAPVFKGVEYRLAAPLRDYPTAFDSVVAHSTSAAFACNCILNYLYCGLEGRRAGALTGPVTYGEIAHLLLNQTLVSLHIRG